MVPPTPGVASHDASAASLPLTEGQIHDSAAEVVDSPLLLLRIAQSRHEMTKLMDWMRGAGLGSEGQISQAMMRRALAAIGVCAGRVRGAGSGCDHWKSSLASVYAAVSGSRARVITWS